MKHLYLLRKFTKYAYKIRGFARLAEFIRRYYIEYHCRKEINAEYSIMDFDGDLFFSCFINEHIGSKIFWRGYYSGDQLMLLEKLLQPDMVFIDVGANQGEFTCFAAKRLKQGRVVSFEPTNETYNRLLKNIGKNNFINVTAVKKGVGLKREIKKLHINNDKYVDGSINSGLNTFFPEEKNVFNTESVEVISLDDFCEQNEIRRVDVIKIDVEGSELFVLQGAQKIIALFRPVILLEINNKSFKAAGYSSEEVINLLLGSQYKLKLIMKNGLLKDMDLKESVEYQNIAVWPK